MNDVVTESVQRSLNRHGIERSTPLVLGFSGGRDSTVLATVLNRLEFSAVTLLYVDHGVRSKGELKRERTSVRDTAAVLGFPLVYRTIHGELTGNGRGVRTDTETRLRRGRYIAFTEELEVGGSRVLLTAHHRDDNVETLLMRIFRGHGVWESGGIPANRSLLLASGEEALILRPLLDVSSREIGEFVEENKLGWSEDSTNGSSDYRRNVVRHEILPVIEKTYPDIRRSLLRLEDQRTEIIEALETEEMPLRWDFAGTDRIRCNRGDFTSLSLPRRFLLLRKGVSALGAPVYRVTYQSVHALFDRIEKTSGNYSGYLYEEVEIQVYSDVIELKRAIVRPLHSGYLWRIEPNLHLSVDRPAGTVRSVSTEKAQVWYTLRVRGTAPVVRSVLPEDTITVDGITRSVRGIIVNSGIGKEDRDLVPLVEDDDGVVAVLGRLFGSTDRFRTEKDEEILKEIRFGLSFTH